MITTANITAALPTVTPPLLKRYSCDCDNLYILSQSQSHVLSLSLAQSPSHVLSPLATGLKRADWLQCSALGQPGDQDFGVLFALLNRNP